jgi:LysM repeat protein
MFQLFGPRRTWRLRSRLLLGGVLGLGLMLSAALLWVSVQTTTPAAAPSFSADPASEVSPPDAVIDSVTQGVNSTTDDAAFAAVTLPAPPPSSARPTHHRVAAGETLLAIADRYDLRPETLVWANDLGNADIIIEGQELVIPPGDGLLHTVQPDDGLAELAGRYGITLASVVSANSLADPVLLQLGQPLFLPGARPQAPNTVAGQVQPDPTGPSSRSSAPDDSVAQALLAVS